jgi:putative membrane protein
MNTYLLFKSIHLIAVISWMAGLLYLPRIFVYHAETLNKGDKDNTFKTMERRLFFYIMNPSMILSWIFGLLLLHLIGMDSFKEFWLIAKLILVASLTSYHFFLFNCLRRFDKNQNEHSPKFFRFINEVPTVLLIAIIFIVVFKPI